MSDAGATFQSARNAPEPEWNVALKEGEDQLVELDLDQMERAVLDGSLLIDGQPAAGWTVALKPANRPSGRPSEFPQTVLDVGGHFHLETPVMGQQTLTLTSPADRLPLALRAAVELFDGQRNWSLSLETGTLELSDVPLVAHEHYRPHLRWQGAEGMSGTHRTHTRCERQPAARGFARGDARVRRSPRGTQDRGGRAADRRAELGAGDHARLVNGNNRRKRTRFISRHFATQGRTVKPSGLASQSVGK